MSNVMAPEEVDLVVQAVLDGAERPASVDPALWETLCSLYARLRTMPKERLAALLEEAFPTRH